MNTTNTESNRLIAEFMGYECNEFGYINDPSSPKYVRGFEFPNGRPPVEQLEFQFSWDWLRPVLDNIWASSDDYTRQFAGLVIFELGLFSDISEVYNAVVQFIKWYNEQTNKNEK